MLQILRQITGFQEKRHCQLCLHLVMGVKEENMNIKRGTPVFKYKTFCISSHKSTEN
jgi:hypothetical protein